MNSGYAKLCPLTNITIIALTRWVLKMLWGFDIPITGLSLSTLKLIPRQSRQFACPSQLLLQSMITKLHTCLQVLRGQMHKNKENRIVNSKGSLELSLFIKSFLSSSSTELRSPGDVICGFMCDSPVC